MNQLDKPLSPFEFPKSQPLLLGHIVRGSLQGGLTLKLDGGCPVESVRAGKFVVVDGETRDFFAMITDITLESSAPRALTHPPHGGRREKLLQRILAGAATYGSVNLRPQLMRLKLGGAFEPVKTIPVHFSGAREATGEDIADVFGAEEVGSGHFHIGSPLEMEEIDVCLDLRKFAERSNGIFGKSGTGKSFLTRIVLCGMIKHNTAVNLIFDMHNEYGWMGRTEDKDRQGVRGLKQIFNNKVRVASLDPESTRRRSAPVESTVKIAYSQVTVDDILLLRDELNLNETTAETVYLLERAFNQNWLKSLLDMTPQAEKDFCDVSGAHPASVGALSRKLKRMVGDCKGFLSESASEADDGIQQIMSWLDRGQHVVLEFGQYRKPLQYILVANILTRRIHHDYTRRMEEAQGDKGREPLPLVITIEEAHKFLSPGLAKQTIFGTIARELRKYNVTLLIVDQRPSGIDDEVLSQIGTRITCLLNDERDIDAVLKGVSGASELKGILASLDSKQQALLLGHALPMPVVVKTRNYDDAQFRQAMGSHRELTTLTREDRAAAAQEVRGDW